MVLLGDKHHLVFSWWRSLRHRIVLSLCISHLKSVWGICSLTSEETPLILIHSASFLLSWSTYCKLLLVFNINKRFHVITLYCFKLAIWKRNSTASPKVLFYLFNFPTTTKIYVQFKMPLENSLQKANSGIRHTAIHLTLCGVRYVAR